MKYTAKSGQTYDLSKKIVKDADTYYRVLREYSDLAVGACKDYRMDIFYGLVRVGDTGDFMQANFFIVPVEHSELDGIVRQFSDWRPIVAYADRYMPHDEVYHSDMPELPYSTSSGVAFENQCKQFLVLAGFEDVQTTPVTGDHGADLTATLNGHKYVFQCKRYSGNVGYDAVKEVYAARDIYNADYAVVITNSHFTQQAIDDAAKLGVELWDGDRIGYNQWANNA